MGSSAFLIVPAIHAAERKSLNSYPSFDTRVTYSVVFVSAILIIRGAEENDVVVVTLRES